MILPPPTSTLFPYTTLFRSDEIQNIERIQVDSDLRSKILYDTLIEFRNKKNVEQIIISGPRIEDRKSTRLNSSHVRISYAVFCLKKKKTFKILYTTICYITI